MQKRYLLGLMTWKVTERNVWKDVANLQIRRLSNFTKSQTPCMDNHQFKEEENESVGGLSTVCSQIVLICLYLARFGRPDILWSVSKLARAVTKWTQSCDKRLACLISYIHHTSEYRQYCYVGKHCQTIQIGIVSRLRFCRRSCGLKIYFWWNIVRFWKSYICSNQLDV